jgi:hypothetical protein
MSDSFSILAIQHLLPSQHYLFAELAKNDDVRRLTILPKTYSHIPGTLNEIADFKIVESVEALIAQRSSRMLILDEGGLIHGAVASLGLQAVGVEQTTNGMRDSWSYPVVLVARCGAKLVFESQIIANGIVRKLASLGLINSKNKFGVIGMGALGEALFKKLDSIGEYVEAYDKIKNAPHHSTRNSLLKNSDVLLGCTGKQSVTLNDLPLLKKSVVLASCSSGQKEFENIATLHARPSSYETLEVPVSDGTAYVLNGGYPVNFDRQKEWETDDEIWLTRSLMLAGANQALSLWGEKPGGYALSPNIQVGIVEQWRKRCNNDLDVAFPETPLTSSYFEQNSEGLHYNVQ